MARFRLVVSRTETFDAFVAGVWEDEARKKFWGGDYIEDKDSHETSAMEIVAIGEVDEAMWLSAVHSCRHLDQTYTDPGGGTWTLEDLLTGAGRVLDKSGLDEPIELDGHTVFRGEDGRLYKIVANAELVELSEGEEGA